MHFAFYILIFALCFLSSCASSRYETSPQSAVASWYGPEFHGRLTASGERFDMHNFTCAHREFPFGTILTVTNMTNGRSVSCIVNDRGPFVPERDIDLSYATAKEIGLIGSGTGNVEIAYLGRDSGYRKEVRYISSMGPYTVQVGSFTERENALRLKAGLELKYENVYIAEASVNNTSYYRVRIGKFSRTEDAYRFAKALAQEGYSPWIVRYDERA